MIRLTHFFALVAALASTTDAFSAPATSLAFSPDGSVIASASGQNVTLLSAATGNETGSFSFDGERALAVDFQPGGSLLAVGTGIPGEKGGVYMVDWLRGKRVGPVATNVDVVTSIAFSPDGELLAVASADKSARVFRVEDYGGKLVSVFALNGHSAAVQALAFSPDGQTLVTASVDRSLKVWSAADGKLIRSFGQHTDAVQALAFRPLVPDRPDAPPYCASGGDDRTVRVWQPTVGRMVRIVRQHDGPVLALVFTPDGRSLFSAGKAGMVRRIDADSDEVLGEFRGSSDWIYALAVSPDGRMLASGAWTGKVSRWSVGEKEINSVPAGN